MTLWGPTSGKILRLPRGLPRGSRHHLGGRCGNVLAERRGDARYLYCNQRAQLDGHLLIVVRQGFLRLKIENISLTVEAGQGILVSELNFEISELVAPGQGVAAFSWFFFDAATLGKLSSLMADIGVWQGYANLPCAQNLIGFDEVKIRAVESLVHDGPESFLLRLLRVRLNEFHPPLIKLLFNRIILPRFKVRLFVENLVFLSKEQVRAFRTRYPGGSGALGRELSRLGLPSLARLVAQRRRELRRAARERGLLAPSESRPKRKRKASSPTGTSSMDEASPMVDMRGSGHTSEDVKDDTFSSTPEKSWSVSGSLPLKEVEVKILQSVQREEINRILSSKIMQFPGMEVYTEMMMAA